MSPSFFASDRSSQNRRNSNKSASTNKRSQQRRPVRFQNKGRNSYRHKSIDISIIIENARNSKTQVVTAPEVSQHQFSDFQVQQWLKDNVAKRGYTQPTPIQDKVIPLVVENKDVVGLANTGTGKTAAFLIPLIDKIMVNQDFRVLIITPTRELAAQIKQEALDFAQQKYLNIALCIGGVSFYRQVEVLRRKPDMVIGTPGRLLDLHGQGKLDFGQFSAIVLDEVDRMLDMGFIRDIRQIISYLPQKRQSLFFSATLSPAAKSIMSEFLKDPVIVSVKSREVAHNVDQDIVRTGGRAKIEVLHDLLNQQGFVKVIVFGRTKSGIEKLSKQLFDRGFRVEALHGNKRQSQRIKALNQFKNNRVSILLATDVAARGLDIDDVTHVINYDLPETYDDYVHRIGRTGRANKKGIALSLVD